MTIYQIEPRTAVEAVQIPGSPDSEAWGHLICWLLENGCAGIEIHRNENSRSAWNYYVKCSGLNETAYSGWWIVNTPHGLVGMVDAALCETYKVHR